MYVLQHPDTRQLARNYERDYYERRRAAGQGMTPGPWYKVEDDRQFGILWSGIVGAPNSHYRWDDIPGSPPLILTVQVEQWRDNTLTVYLSTSRGLFDIMAYVESVENQASSDGYRQFHARELDSTIQSVIDRAMAMTEEQRRQQIVREGERYLERLTLARDRADEATGGDR